MRLDPWNAFALGSFLINSF